MKDTIKYLMDEIERVKEKRIEHVEYLKKNISNDYILALLDITIIDNVIDSIQTLEHIYQQLSDLQNRIIERNKRG